MKKLFIILSLILVLSFVVCITTFAVVSASVSKIESEDEFFTRCETRSGIALTKNINLDGNNTALKYAKTEFLSDSKSFNDIYIDSNKSEYRYNENGDFVAFTNFSFGNFDYLNMKSIDDVKAEELAFKFASSMYGETFVDMTVEEITDGEGLKTVKFSQKPSADSLITGAVCYVDVRNDGEIFSTSFSNVSSKSDMDTILNGEVPEKELIEYAENRIAEDFGGDIVSYKINKINIIEKDSSYFYRILFVVEYTDGACGAFEYEVEA